MKRKTRTIRNIVLVAAGVATGLLMGAARPVGKETSSAIPKTATIIPAPREIGWDQIFIESAKRDFAEFSARAAEYRRRLIGAHVNCAPLK